jgi:hypothetical protein
MTILYVLLGGLAVLCLCLHVLTRRFKADCIDGDPACPIREQRRIWNHIGWFSKSSDEKSYVKRHAPWLFLLNRITMLWVFVTAPLLIFLLLAGRPGA